MTIDEVTTPYLVFMQVGKNKILSYDGVNELQEARFRFSCYAGTYRQARLLAQALMALLDGYTGTLADGTPVTNVVPVGDNDETEDIFHGTIYSSHCDYYFWFLDVGKTS